MAADVTTLAGGEETPLGENGKATTGDRTTADSWERRAISWKQLTRNHTVLTADGTDNVRRLQPNKSTFDNESLEEELLEREMLEGDTILTDHLLQADCWTTCQTAKDPHL